MIWEVNNTDLQHMTRRVCCLVTSLVPIVHTFDYMSTGDIILNGDGLICVSLGF